MKTPLSRAFVRRRRTPGLLALGLALGLGAGAAAGCSSMGKSDLERELLELPKNQAFAEAGLRRFDWANDPDAGFEASELVYVHLTRSSQPVEDGPSTTPVVLVHGTPSTLFTWSELAAGGEDFAGLAAERDVYAIEVVGHGVAPGSGDPLTFEACARFVEAAIEALGLERAHLVGHSYGAEFAWRAAANRPDLVASLTVMNGSGYERRQEDWLPEELEMRENSLADYGWLLNSRERITTALTPHFAAIPPDRVEEFYLVCENSTNWKAMIDLAQDENGERQVDIATIGVPTLVLWGRNDVAYPPDVYAERFAGDVQGAELRLVDAGHYPHEERPAEVAEALAGFFGDVESGVVRRAAPVSVELSVELLPGEFEVRPRRIEAGQLSESGYAMGFGLPAERGTPGRDLLAEMERLVALRFDARDADGRALRNLGDLVAAARSLEPRARTTWLADLGRRNPQLMSDWGPALAELLLEDALGANWDPSGSDPRDGVLEAESWNLTEEGRAPWTGLGVDAVAEQAAVLICADLAAIKAGENDYRLYASDIGAEYEQIGPQRGSYVRGEDFAGVTLTFRCDLPLWYGDYTCELRSLTHFDERGRLVCDIESTSEDFYWLAGRDVYLPIDTSAGERVAILVVRQYGFDLDGVPDSSSNRREALRGSLGNLKLRAEAQMGDASQAAGELQVPEFRVFGRSY